MEVAKKVGESIDKVQGAIDASRTELEALISEVSLQSVLQALEKAEPEIGSRLWTRCCGFNEEYERNIHGNFKTFGPFKLEGVSFWATLEKRPGERYLLGIMTQHPYLGKPSKRFESPEIGRLYEHVREMDIIEMQNH